MLEREASAYQEFHPATFVAMPRNCDGEPAALYALASSSAPGFRLSFQPSQPPWPASRYWTTLGRLSVSNAYATPSLYPAALSWQVVRSMLVTRLGSESGSMRRAKAVLGFALRIVAIARDRIRRGRFLQYYKNGSHARSMYSVLYRSSSPTASSPFEAFAAQSRPGRS